jgi:hypothetical protein
MAHGMVPAHWQTQQNDKLKHFSTMRFQDLVEYIPNKSVEDLY